MSKTCGECKHYDVVGQCNKVRVFNLIHDYTLACIKFEAKNPTNGDRIIAGGMRELAKAMVYGYRVTDFDGQVMDGMLYTWHLPNAKAFTEYNEAVDFLENWLNAPAGCVKQNGKNDTQADLCKAGKTESEVKDE